MGVYAGMVCWRATMFALGVVTDAVGEACSGFWKPVRRHSSAGMISPMSRRDIAVGVVSGAGVVVAGRP